MAELPEDMDMGWPGGEADGEEEPLFADDLMDDEDDPPPLPPPMPSLGEFSGVSMKKFTLTIGGGGIIESVMM